MFLQLPFTDTVSMTRFLDKASGKAVNHLAKIPLPLIINNKPAHAIFKIPSLTSIIRTNDNSHLY